MSGSATTRVAERWSFGCRIAGIAALALLAIARLGSAPPSDGVRVYDDNPSHLWNRLHASLFVRAAADGRDYGVDRVDPLLWTGSMHLLQGTSHDDLRRLLNEFITTTITGASAMKM